MTARVVVLAALAQVPMGAAAQQVGEVFRDCEACPEMVVVPAGSFIMGSPETEEGRRNNEGPQRRVTIDYAFAVGVYEVTFDEWGACVQGGGCGGYQPDDWLGTGWLPVRDVRWEDAWQYADWLTRQTGEEYRLLSEAEWEYVARAGTQTARYWGDGTREQCQYANGDSSVGCRDRQEDTAPVGSYRPNEFGLHDVLGNVWEWVDDCYGSYDDAPTDGLSSYAGDCDYRVLRGGGFYYAPDYLRSARRRRGDANSRNLHHGFRVARSVKLTCVSSVVEGLPDVTTRRIFELRGKTRVCTGIWPSRSRTSRWATMQVEREDDRQVRTIDIGRH